MKNKRMESIEALREVVERDLRAKLPSCEIAKGPFGIHVQTRRCKKGSGLPMGRMLVREQCEISTGVVSLDLVVTATVDGSASDVLDQLQALGEMAKAAEYLEHQGYFVEIG